MNLYNCSLCVVRLSSAQATSRLFVGESEAEATAYAMEEAKRKWPQVRGEYPVYQGHFHLVERDALKAFVAALEQEEE